jgi:hypothetical protein
MSAQVPGRAHRAPGPSVLVVCHTHGAPGRAHKSSDHAHQLPDTRTGRRTHPASRLTDPVRSLIDPARTLTHHTSSRPPAQGLCCGHRPPCASARSPLPFSRTPYLRIPGCNPSHLCELAVLRNGGALVSTVGSSLVLHAGEVCRPPLSTQAKHKRQLRRRTGSRGLNNSATWLH